MWPFLGSLSVTQQRGNLLGLASLTEHNAFEIRLFYGVVCFFLLLSIPFIYVFNVEMYPKYIRMANRHMKCPEKGTLWRQIDQWLPEVGGGNRE